MTSIFRPLFQQTFHVAKYQGTDFRGVETHGAPEPHPCRSEPTNKLARDTNGVQVVAEAVLQTEAQVEPEDLVWLPGEDPTDVGASRKPLTVAPRPALLTGVIDHYEVTL
ncbi:hypothetical protein ACN28E_24965 [Archangium lansingense]|uniref:hypothetical protein n=1 Tax=Archangium lansingense TaxID=2995310 RepID=UPI003B7B1497